MWMIYNSVSRPQFPRLAPVHITTMDRIYLHQAMAKPQANIIKMLRLA